MRSFIQQLPNDCLTEDCNSDIHKRNILKIDINMNQEIQINDKDVIFEDILQKTIDFLDNNGNHACDYCNGESIETSSVHPSKAVISFQYDPQVKYELYVKVQDELSKAYSFLREQYAQKKFQKSVEKLSDEQLKLLKKAYPMKISEVSLR